MMQNKPTVYNMGYIGDTKTWKNGKQKKSYHIWNHMLERCYGTRYLKYKTYDDCYVSEEWLCYANFEKWFDENYYEIEGNEMNLDKDILVKGNKCYSKDTCVFVPKRINTLFTKNNKNRGDLPIGVQKGKNGNYRSICHKVHLGMYQSKEEAFAKYKEYKENQIKQIANFYMEKIPIKLYNALINYEVDYND